MSIIYRVYGMGCSICSSERKISIPEKTILYYLKKFSKEEIIANYRSDTINNKELDILLPNRNIGVEYDGIFFHQNKKRDLEKDLLCKKIGITVVHIAESKSGNQVKDNYIYYDFTKQANLEWAINILLNRLMNTNKNYDVDIKRDRIEIYSLIDYYEKEQSLLKNYPNIAKEWNYEKNGKLRPEFVSYGSSKKVWWKCSKGHEYEAIIHSRTAGAGCPFCANQKVLKGYNDLESTYPNIAKEWNYEKNGKLRPKFVSYGSQKKVWWKCSEGHEWEATVYGRTIRGHNCLFCTGQKAIKGKNDLLTVNPELAKEWNYEKNGDLKPENFMPNSHKKVWWKCSKGHEYEAIIGDRNIGNGCPFCANQKLLVGYNDLMTKNPELAKEWNYEKNGNLKPSDFFPNTNKKVWWKCPYCNCEWQLAIVDMTKRKYKCSKCKIKDDKEH